MKHHDISFDGVVGIWAGNRYQSSTAMFLLCILQLHMTSQFKITICILDILDLFMYSGSYLSFVAQMFCISLQTHFSVFLVFDSDNAASVYK